MKGKNGTEKEEDGNESNCMEVAGEKETAHMLVYL
jgi:hypothetical protein